MKADMSVTTGAVQRTGRREEKKKLEIFVARRAASQKRSAPDKQPEIRSPLMERSNRDLQKKSEQVKPLKKKMAEPVNKENIRPAVNKDGKSVTFTQSFLKTKNIKEKQINEKVKPESTKDEAKLPTKPVLGTYRGKIVQSKINSFRKNHENNIPEPKKTVAESQEKRPQPSASAPAKAMVRPAANSIKSKRPVIPPVSSQIRPSTTLTKSKAELVTVRRTTQVLVQQKPVQQKVQTVKPTLKNEAVKKNPMTQSKKSSSGPAKTLLEPQKNKPALQLPTASKFSRPKESAEERKARLAEWRQSKGKMIKRPSMAIVMPSKCSMHKKEPEIKTELEEPKEETQQLYWDTLMEEDERERFTVKVQQMFGDCHKLIDEGCPREKVLSILDKKFENIPEAKKLSGYWECLARLEKRDGQLSKVIAICQEAVSSGAQPLEEIQAILADASEQLKTDQEESVRKENEEDLKSEDLKTEVKEPVETAVKEKRRRARGRAVKNEPKSPSTPDKPSKSESTPGNGAVESSVIRFNVCSTPRLGKMMNLQMNEGDSSVKNYTFLTPVRRSSRLERKSHRLPDMLKDHDPCVSGIVQLGELEETETFSNPYIIRKNRALDEVTAKSATKKD
ncbi:cytoskeleton-associated protein 2 [Bufo gargarizans]|uniref:cytoskeleton-associated protein 2 n=1 Tax=Bufo gargarizans TaxID=30331 RepID=UPI001CF2FB7D|nr:cytoskeleton-associated protein 2 [Bufo gargarizans]